MRLKFLSVFLALQVLSFALWTQYFSIASAESELKHVSQEGVKASALQLASAALLEADGSERQKAEEDMTSDEDGGESEISGGEGVATVEPLISELSTVKEVTYTPRFAAQNQSEENKLLEPIHQDQVARALAQLPLAHAEAVQSVTLDYNPEAHRGLGGGSLIFLRAANVSSEEFVSVLIHETGHNVDYGVLTPLEKKIISPFTDGQMPLYETDPSLDFYRLSWDSDHQMKAGVTDLDFVSGYAMSDPFEDFAETYIYYVLHNKEFLAYTQQSEVLLAKYNFMRDTVFQGQVFETGAEPLTLSNDRPWDTTVLPYELGNFM